MATTTTSTLIAHCGAELVTREELATLPAPVPLGRRHRPIAHAELVTAIHQEAAGRGLAVRKEAYALGRGGAALFGVLDFARTLDPEASFALGFRSSQDESLALSGRAGLRVFVCDNLALAGNVFAFRKRHTSRLDLAATVREGFDRYEEQGEALAGQVRRLQSAEVTEGRAKEVIYDAFASGVVPTRLLSSVHSFYFEPTPERPDCAPRTMWGLHNAFTRALHALKPARAWRASGDVGRYFGLRAAA